MKKHWKRAAVPAPFRAAKMVFTVNKTDNNGVTDILQINTLFIPKEVYNAILRDKKIDNLMNHDGKISIHDMYFALLKHAENYEIQLVDFKRVI